MAAHIAQQLSSASLEDARDDDDVYEVCTAVALVRKTPALDSAELAAVPRGARNLLLEGDLGAVARTGQRRVRWRVGRDEGFVSRRCLRPVAWRAASRRTGRARWRVEVATWAPVLGENGREWRFLMELVPEPEERERIARFHHACDRCKALASRLAARCVCDVCLGVSEVVIARTKGKKPFLVSEAPCDTPNFNFNVSHDGRHVIIAAEPLCIVGVDVCAPDSERKGGGEQDLTSMRDMLTVREWAWLGEGDRGERFRLLWSGKEAFAKARGDGLGFAFKRLDLEVAPVRCRDGRKLFTGTPWVDGLNVSSDWRISLEVFEDGHVFALALGPPACVVDAHGLFRATLKQPVISSKDLDADLHAEWTPLCIADLVPDHLRKEYAQCVDEDERSLTQPPYQLGVLPSLRTHLTRPRAGPRHLIRRRSCRAARATGRRRRRPRTQRRAPACTGETRPRIARGLSTAATTTIGRPAAGTGP